MEGPKKGTSDVDGAIAAAQLGVGGMQAMTDILGSIQNAAERKLIIELSNFTDGPMLDPKIYMSFGQVLDPPPPTAPAKEMVAFSFIKNATADGVYGIILYNVCDVNKSPTCNVAILFSVPFSRASYGNTFKICVLKHDENGSAEELFKNKSNEMKTATGSQVKDEALGYVVKATMSETASATMKVEISKKS